MSEGELSEELVPRVPTGVPGLDTILHGGWLHGGTYMIVGDPGTGKTVLGNQFCFSHVARGGRAVYLTLLGEAHGRMKTHLESLRFFQQDVIGQSLHYVSGYAPLKAEGLEGLSRLLYHLVREHQATALVVDWLLPVEESADSRLAFHEFLHSLGVHNALAGCTTLVIGKPQEGPSAVPDFAMVDGVVVLGMRLMGLRAVRTLEVMKLRGGPHLTGLHTFDITRLGLEVYPRIETLYPHQRQGVTEPGRRLTFDVPGLDALLGGGLPANSSTMMLGSPGSGKTLLGLHFLGAGARQGEPGLYFGFTENAPRLLSQAAGVGLELGPYVDAGQLVLETETVVEALPDALAQQMLDLAERHRARRLFIDGLEPFVSELLAPARVNGFLTALTNVLRARGITALVSQQLPTFFGPQLEAPLHGGEAIVDNLILLRQWELRSRLYRMLSVLKMRESAHDASLREFHIRSEGIDVSDTSESAEAILTGQAGPRPPKGSKKLPRKPGRRPPARRSRP